MKRPNVFVGVKLDPATIAKLDAVARKHQASRSFIIRQLLNTALLNYATLINS